LIVWPSSRPGLIYGIVKVEKTSGWSIKPLRTTCVEKAMFNSISDFWPKCNIYGYFFHLAQAMLRNVNKRHKI